MLPAVVKLKDVPHQAQLFSIELGSYKLFSPAWPGTRILPISASVWLGMTTAYNQVQLMVETVSSTFCLGWPQTMILQISASQVARVTSTSHHMCLASL
jgi:hypothetical protein